MSPSSPAPAPPLVVDIDLHFLDLVRAVALDRLRPLSPLSSGQRRVRRIDRLRIDGLDRGVVFDRLAEERILIADVRIRGVARAKGDARGGSDQRGA